MPNSSWAEQSHRVCWTELGFRSLDVCGSCQCQWQQDTSFLPAKLHTHTQREGRGSGADKNKSINYTKAMESFMPSLEPSPFSSASKSLKQHTRLEVLANMPQSMQKPGPKIMKHCQAGSQSVSQPPRQTSCTCRSQLTEDHVSTSLRRQRLLLLPAWPWTNLFLFNQQ